ncbi:MAG: hypothetical protein AAF840_04630 [Bacteroidota bacterium]
MSTFRNTLLADLTNLCQSLYERRIAQVITQQLVSDKAKKDIIVLVVQLNHLREKDPFPDQADLDTVAVEELKTAIQAADADDKAIQEKLLTWATNASGISINEEAEEDEENFNPSPINQRMLDNLDTLRSTIDRTRGRVILDPDYDHAAYVAARNAYTLSRTVYQKRLQLNQIETTNAQAAEMEDVIITDIANATAAKFPETVQASADFMSKSSFPPLV